MGTYTIGEVAERSGFSASALRYYEGIGLVAPSTRTDAGYRLYDDHSLARLSFIARAKRLGCSLEEITDLVAIWDGPHCGSVQRRFQRLVIDKIDDAHRQIDELTVLSRQLQEAAVQLESPPADGPCGPRCTCLGDNDTTTTAVPIELTAKPDPPIACTLGSDDLARRLDDWQAMLAHATVRRATPDGGLRIAFDCSVDVAALARLLVSEQQCCPFYSFGITVGPDGIALDVRAPRGAEGMVAELFGQVAS